MVFAAPFKAAAHKKAFHPYYFALYLEVLGLSAVCGSIDVITSCNDDLEIHASRQTRLTPMVLT
jgi:hypothetical protein